MKSVAIIGGGIIGLSIGYKLSIKYPGWKITLFEKESKFGQHQSGNNSGVLHCGLYYKPNSLKAKLAVDGIREMVSFCRKNNIKHEICGKVVVASNEKEIIVLNNLAIRGEKNGLKGLKFLSPTELNKREPNVKALKSLLVPQEGIVDYAKVMETFASHIKEKNGEIYPNNKVTEVIKLKNGNNLIRTKHHEKEFELIICCTGLFSDRIYKNFTKKKCPLQIVPFRGEYVHISEEYQNIVNHLVYPVPDPKYPFLGVHFTRMINGGREVGPNAVLALKREGYKNSDFSLYDTIDSLFYKGFIKFLSSNFKFAIEEFASSLSTSAFVTKAKKLIPEVEEYMFAKRGTSGVRAQAIRINGELEMDFNIIRENNQIHILNAPSPGATASLSIAKFIVDNYV